jgi:CRP-like cAMP-binding protein
MYCNTHINKLYIQKRLLRVGRYERWLSGRLILREGHHAMNFYVILDGEVEVFKTDQEKMNAAYNASQNKKPIDINIIEEDYDGSECSSTSSYTESDTHSSLAESESSIDSIDSDHIGEKEEIIIGKSEAHRSVSSNALALSSTEQEDIRERDAKLADMERAYRVTLGTQSSGDSFGELSFLNDGIHQSSILTKRTTEFLVISKDDYEEVMTTTQNTDVREKITYLRAMPLLNTLSVQMENLAHYCDLISYSPNSVVVCEGDNCDYVYFIR